MTIQNLRIFSAVYTNKSMTIAANELGLSQPQVSRTIKELEEILGVQLFERIGHKIHATEAGAALYQRVNQVISFLDNTDLELSRFQPSPNIRLGVNKTFGDFFLPAVLSEFSVIRPSVKMHVFVDTRQSLLNRLKNNEIDFALIDGPTGALDTSFSIQEFTEDPLLLIIPPDWPSEESLSVQFSELYSYPLILREKGSALRSFIDTLALSNGKPLVPFFESISTPAILSSVHAGLGVSILPLMQTAQAISTHYVGFRTFADANLKRKCYIVQTKGKVLTDIELFFLNLCKQKAAHTEMLHFE